jgi:hypothetical protein
VTAWLAVLAVTLTLAASGAMDEAGWVFYRLAMRQAARKRAQRELYRQALATAMAEYRTVQLSMLASLYQHEQTMAALTGQPYGDPRHNPWQFPMTQAGDHDEG